MNENPIGRDNAGFRIDRDRQWPPEFLLRDSSHWASFVQSGGV